MIFPRLVFRSPGSEQCQGGTYRYVCVADQVELDAHLSDGWHATLPDALMPQVRHKEEKAPEPIKQTTITLNSFGKKNKQRQG